MTKAKKGKYKVTFGSTGPTMIKTSSHSTQKGLASFEGTHFPAYVADFQGSERWRTPFLEGASCPIVPSH